MKRIALVTSLAICLVLPSAAAAKIGLDEGSLLLCGPEACLPIDDSGTLESLARALWGEPGLGAEPPADPAAYYELRFTGSPRELAAYLVPSSGMLLVGPNVRAGVGWTATPPAAAAGLGQLHGGLEPFPEPTVVRVDLEPGYAADPAPYLALVGSLPEGSYPSAKTPRVSLDLVTADPSPWTPRGAHVQLSYAPEERAVLGDAGWRAVPPELAALIERDSAAAPPAAATADVPEPAPAPEPAAAPAPGGARADGLPWALVVGVAAGVVALVALVVTPGAARRHRSSPGATTPRPG
jgi:hypothetical protein